MPPPEVELRNRVLQSSTEGSQPTPRACPRGTVPIRPTASSQYVGLSTANYFRHITTTTMTTTTTTTQTLKATGSTSRQAATSTASRQATTSAASRQAATPYSRQQQRNHTSSSSGRPSNDVRSSGVTPVQATISSSNRRVGRGGSEETRPTPSAKGPASQPHLHTTNEATAARVEDHQHTVVDLVEYGLRHNLMDKKLFMVLYDRAAKELVRQDHVDRFNFLMEQFYDSRPSVCGGSSASESTPARTSTRTTPVPTRRDPNQAQYQPRQHSQQPQPGQVVTSRPLQDVQRQGPRSQQAPPPPSPRRHESTYDYDARREEAQNHGGQPRIHKRTLDQLDLISPGHVISMKRTRTEYQSRSTSQRR
jgi:hypothetical protein